MILIVRTAAITVAFPGARFTYAEGALHSSDDAPAFIVSAAGNKYHKGVYATAGVGPGPHRSIIWQKAPLGIEQSFINIAEENRWYDKGELHRGFGPAVHGRADVAGVYYWHKYDRGVLGAGPLNTFEANGEHFSCAPGAILCSFTQYNERTPYRVETRTNWVTVRMYYNNTTGVVSATSGTMSLGHRSAPRSPEPITVTFRSDCRMCTSVPAPRARSRKRLLAI
jgi:hypothetical protein